MNTWKDLLQEVGEELQQVEEQMRDKAVAIAYDAGKAKGLYDGGRPGSAGKHHLQCIAADHVNEFNEFRRQQLILKAALESRQQAFNLITGGKFVENGASLKDGKDKTGVELRNYRTGKVLGKGWSALKKRGLRNMLAEEKLGELKRLEMRTA